MTVRFSYIALLAALPLVHAASSNARLLFRSHSLVVDRVTQVNDLLLTVEANNHRVTGVDWQGNVQWSLGSIGQDAGELYYPGDLVRDRKGYLYVLEVRNERIQIFDQARRSIGTFPVHSQPYGMAVNSKGELLLGQPANGKLISVYAPNGKLLRSFGELRRASDFYGRMLAGRDKPMRQAINRIHIACDAQDNTYVAFLAAAVWRKYDAAGQMLLESKLEFPEAAQITRDFAEKLKAHATVTFDEDESAIPYVMTGMAVDNATHRLLFSARGDKSWFITTNFDGSSAEAFPLDDSGIMIRNVAPVTDGLGLIALGAKPGHYNEVYYIEFPRNAGRSNRKEVKKQ
jgi:hypothetical protein